jgi:hypothetical protein
VLAPAFSFFLVSAAVLTDKEALLPSVVYTILGLQPLLVAAFYPPILFASEQPKDLPLP